MTPQELEKIIENAPNDPEGARSALLAEEQAALTAERWAKWRAACASKDVKTHAEDFARWRSDASIRWRISGPQGVYQGARYENFEVATDVQRFALESVRCDSRSVDGDCWSILTLAGPPGTGKTHLGAAWYAERVCDLRAQFISARALLRLFENAKGPAFDDLMRHFGEGEAAPGRDADEPVEELFGAWYLVLDDLGSSPTTTREADLIREVIDLRTTNQCPTLITTNGTRDDLRALLGGSGMSRIESGPWVPLTGSDQRKAPRRAWMDSAASVPLPGLSETEEVEDLRKREADADEAARALAARSDHLARVREALASLAPTATASAAPSVEALTLCDVKALTAKAAGLNRDAVVRALWKYGAKRAPEVKPEQWDNYAAELREIIDSAARKG